MTPPIRLDICKGKLEVRHPISTKNVTFRVLLRCRRGHDPALRRSIQQSDKLKFEKGVKERRRPERAAEVFDYASAS
jgi:hypothetical protein